MCTPIVYAPASPRPRRRAHYDARDAYEAGMPISSASGIDIHYERSGSGPRLLFLTGSGTTVEGSRPVIGSFAASFDTVAPDYRGMGKSAIPPGPYGMADCAGDALAVMDHLGWDSARVAGISFGGMVAQELAVEAPGRVERLALLCTSAGGPGGSSYPLHELASLDASERSRVMRTLLDSRFDDRWLAAHPGDRELVRVLEARAAGSGAPGRGARLQLDARRHHDVADRLSSITCPTLVACGRFDGIAPAANSEAIAARIAGAELRVYEGGHALFVQDPRAVPEVVTFLGEASPST